MRLQTKDLHKLNKQWQEDYFAEILRYDDRMHKHIAKIHASVVKKKVGIRNQIEHSQMLKTMWIDGVQKFNEMMGQRLEQMGYQAQETEHGGK